MKKRSLSFIISAPSGAGKTTLCEKLVETFPDVRFSISCTTRDIRSGEIDGKDYHFITREKFQEMINNNAFAEWAEVHGELYGTALKELDVAEKDGVDLILDIDWQGAKQIKEKSPGGIYIFILPPSMEELERRLSGRGKDAEAIIKKRLENAREEITHADWYDYNIVNDNLEEAFGYLKSIVIAERCRPYLAGKKG